jgi:Mg/Co/Ni transporter MgtE
MENTIMTEKIARKGVKTPHSYEPDMLDKISVQQVIKQGGTVLHNDLTIEEAREWLSNRHEEQRNYYIIITKNGNFKGIVSSSNLFSMHHSPASTVESLIKRKPVAITNEDSLKTAVELMARENMDVLPVVSSSENKITGILSYKDILSTYKNQLDEHQEITAISIKRRTLKVLAHGRKKISAYKEKKSEALLKQKKPD